MVDGGDMAISLAERQGDGTLWSIEQMLRDLVDDKERLKGYNKAVVLLLNDQGQYTPGFNQAGMHMSECVLLCEMAKDMFKEEMK
jgi:hypothetical protein